VEGTDHEPILVLPIIPAFAMMWLGKERKQELVVYSYYAYDEQVYNDAVRCWQRMANDKMTGANTLHTMRRYEFGASPRCLPAEWGNHYSPQYSRSPGQTFDTSSTQPNKRKEMFLLYRVVQLLCNDREIGGYTRPISGQRLGKHAPIARQQILNNATVVLQQWKRDVFSTSSWRNA
jgi:hypothetical protein